MGLVKEGVAIPKGRHMLPCSFPSEVVPGLELVVVCGELNAKHMLPNVISWALTVRIHSMSF